MIRALPQPTSSSTFASSGQALDDEPAKDSSNTQENESNTLCVGNFSVSTSQSKGLLGMH